MTALCHAVVRDVHAYMDGELEPNARRAIAAHLASCLDCQARYDDLRHVGDLLREHAAASPLRHELDSLGASVIARVRAEEAQSWKATWRRALDDWYWAWVGAGSLAAAACSLLVVSLLCGFGPQHAGDDSLAAMLSRMETPVGTLWIIATPAGRDQLPILMQFANGEADAERGIGDVLPAGFSSPSGSDLAMALSDAVVRPDGRLHEWRSMSKRDRQQAEALLGEIQHLRAIPAASWTDRRVSIQKVGFATNTSVFGKAL